MRKAVSLISIENRKILLVKKNKTWILPGGKPNLGESDIECLARELAEELPELIVIGDFKFYKIFTGRTPHKGDVIEVLTYFANIKGGIKPAMEIDEALWVDNFEGIKLSEVTQKIISSLYEDEYLCK